MKHPFQFRKREPRSHEDGGQLASLAQRIGRFFSTEPQKEKVLRHEDFNAAGDVYYATVSAAYKIAQRILVLLLIVFLLVTILTNYREITYDNFYYLIKDFSGAADSDGTRYETLSYEADARQNFVLYRGGIAGVSPSKLSIFTATGRRTLNTTVSFSSPYMVSSGKYVLVYDTSGTTFSLYNSFARVYTETLDYPITDACLSADGSFMIVTRSADYRAVIHRYNRNFKKTGTLNLQAYVFDIVADSERGIFALLTYDEGDGTGRTTLSVRDLSDLEEQKSVLWNGEFPLGCEFLEKGNFGVVTDHAIRILDSDFSIRESDDACADGTLTGYSLTEEGIAVSYTASSKNFVIAFDKSGDLLYNGSVSFGSSALCVYDGYLFFRTDNSVTRLNTKSGEIEQLASGQGSMLVYNAETAVVCGESKAEYLIFRNG